MAKELPYFKFYTSEWLDGDITIEDLETQGLFINICALYWSKEGEVYIDKLIKRFRYAGEDCFKPLIDEGFIYVNEDGKINISFLDEQMKERVKTSKTNSLNGSKGGRPKKQVKSEIKPPALFSESQIKANESNKEERRGEEKREEEKREDIKVANARKILEDKKELFKNFWDLYNKKTGKETVLKKWLKLSQEEMKQVFIHLPKYVDSTPDKSFRKNPLTYLNQKSFNDEIITKTTAGTNTDSVSTRYRKAWEANNEGGHVYFDTSQL